MNDVKAWYQSRTIWASLITLGAGLLTIVGVEIDATAQEQLLNTVLQTITVLGSLTAIAGRISATSMIE